MPGSVYCGQQLTGAADTDTDTCVTVIPASYCDTGAHQQTILAIKVAFKSSLSAPSKDPATLAHCGYQA